MVLPNWRAVSDKNAYQRMHTSRTCPVTLMRNIIIFNKYMIFFSHNILYPCPPFPHPSSSVTSDEMQKLRVSLSETINRNRSILNDFDHSLQVSMFAKMVCFCVLCERVCAVRLGVTCSRTASQPHGTPYDHIRYLNVLLSTPPNMHMRGPRRKQ